MLKSNYKPPPLFPLAVDVGYGTYVLYTETSCQFIDVITGQAISVEFAQLPQNVVNVYTAKKQQLARSSKGTNT